MGARSLGMPAVASAPTVRAVAPPAPVARQGTATPADAMASSLSGGRSSGGAVAAIIVAATTAAAAFASTDEGKAVLDKAAKSSGGDAAPAATVGGSSALSEYGLPMPRDRVAPIVSTASADANRASARAWVSAWRGVSTSFPAAPAASAVSASATTPPAPPPPPAPKPPAPAPPAAVAPAAAAPAAATPPPSPTGAALSEYGLPFPTRRAPPDPSALGLDGPVAGRANARAWIAAHRIRRSRGHGPRGRIGLEGQSATSKLSLAKRLASLGASGVVAYGLFNTLWYTAAFALLWIWGIPIDASSVGGWVANVAAAPVDALLGVTDGFLGLPAAGWAAARAAAAAAATPAAKTMVLAPQASGRGLAATAAAASTVLAGAWVGSQVTKPARMLLAVVAAPTAESVLKKLGGGKRATGMVVGMCLVLAASVVGGLVAVWA